MHRCLKPNVLEQNRYFLHGKFDQGLTVHDDYASFDYAPFSNAITTFCDALQYHRSREDYEEMKGKIGSTVATEKLLMDMIPALSDLISEDLRKDSAEDAIKLIHGVAATGAGVRNQFQVAFRNLLRAICRPESPLVLFLDDVQWADVPSLDLLACLAQDASWTNDCVYRSW